MQIIEEFQLRCRICGKVLSTNFKTYKTMTWAIYNHARFHKLNDLIPIDFPFIMNKPFFNTFVEIKKIESLPIAKHRQYRE
jgi:hypothetical protein